MKRFIVVIIILSTASEAFSATWEFIVEGNDRYKTVVELNTASIEDIGKNIKRAQYRFNYKNYPNGLSEKNVRDFSTTADFDCTQPRYKILHISATSASWEPVSSERLIQPEMPIYDEIGSKTSLIGRVYEAVCSNK